MREITKTNDMKNIHKIKNNIYVTSDEKIKKGDCVINLLSKEVYFITIVNEVVDYEKKIIITDDKNLISNEIQPIDNILKEWFVKNPSCEEVEVGYGFIRLTKTDNKGYWVSIPDEEFNMQEEEPKQETLEEVVEKITRLSRQDAFYEGAKWQEERTCKHIYTLTTEQGHRVIKCSKCNDTQPV